MESTSTSPAPSEPDSSSTPNNSSAVQPNIVPTPSVIEPSATPASSAPETITSSSAPATTPLAPASPTVISPATTVEPDTMPLVAPATDAPQLEAPIPTTPPAAAQRKVSKKTLLLAGVGLLLLIATGASSYLIGKHAAKPATMATTTVQAAMTVPKDATVIEQCSPGFGTQYVLPKDIPGGPVYNVYQGKLIGIEYMTALTSASNPDLMLKDLPLFAQKYDHVDIMTMPAHAGFPSPHYQVDVMMVPTSVSSKITCGSSSMSTSNSTMDSSSSSKSSNSTNMSM